MEPIDKIAEWKPKGYLLSLFKFGGELQQMLLVRFYPATSAATPGGYAGAVYQLATIDMVSGTHEVFFDTMEMISGNEIRLLYKGLTVATLGPSDAISGSGARQVRQFWDIANKAIIDRYARGEIKAHWLPELRQRYGKALVDVQVAADVGVPQGIN